MSAAIPLRSYWRPLCVLARRLAAVPLLVALCWLTFIPAQAAAVTGKVKLSKEDGFNRLTFHFEQQVGVHVVQSNGIVILSFDQPVDVAVEPLAISAAGLIAAARRDPDGRAVRIALARKLKVHSVPAAEWFFLDLLPENWTGLMPGAPQTVVDELARRARAAEQQLRERAGPDPAKQVLSGRVKVAVQPTFTRFIFPLVEGTEAAAERHGDALSVRFTRLVDWDLADALAALPASIHGIAAEREGTATRVIFKLAPEASLRSFRDGDLFMVDVDGEKPAAPAAKNGPSIAPPQSIASDEAKIRPAPEPPLKSAAAAPQPPAEKPEKPANISAGTPPGPVPDAAPAKEKPAIAVALPAASPPAPAPAPMSPHRDSADPKARVGATVQQAHNALTLTFPFAIPTPAAVFQRRDVVWLVFDTEAPVDISALEGDVVGVRNAARVRDDAGGVVLRLTLERPRLVSAAADGGIWTVTIGDTLIRPPLPLSIARTVVARNRANLVVPFVGAARVHRLRDPQIGDRLIAVTALSPERGLLKEQSFMELRALASAQGVAVQPLADDLEARIAPDKVTISRPGGLALSPTGTQTQQIAGTPATFDSQVWGYDRNAVFADREGELIRAAADAPESKRWTARLNLARFYMAREMAAEAKGVLDVALSEPHSKEDVTGSIVHAISNLALERPAEAIKDLAAPQIGKQQNAPLWRAVALVRQGKYAEARDGFKDLETALATLPIEMQRVVLMAALHAAVETRNAAASTRLVQELESVGVSAEWRGEFDILLGREQEDLGHPQEALAKYRAASSSADATAAAQGRLRDIALRLARHELPQKDAIAALETLTVIWRGDDTEAEGLQLLARLYRAEGRYSDAFRAMRNALIAAPDSDITRKIQDEAAASFQELFLSAKGDTQPPVEALGLFYDNRDLTPIGRTGDEMIRRLADRLVAVDLLDQAAELLQHQVDKRLQGAARAQVAAKLATIYLMNHKSERALATLRATRDSDVSNELRQHRLLLEARALSELGRHPLALEIVSELDSPEAHRLRADVLWSAKRWREAAEEIERLYGDRWRDFKPLNETERNDIMRAAIGYALADEGLALARLRQKYAAKMAEGPDARAFDIVTSPIGTSGPEFQDVARRIATVDTLTAFLNETRARFEKKETQQAATDAKPEPTPEPKAEAADRKAPPPPKGGTPLKPDPMPTGSVRARR
jgi:tetratricopeptide (TPR) repeat protein